MEAVYSRAYTEILEILKYLPNDEYERIPKEKIEFFNKYKDDEYEFFFDASMPLEEQKISIEANAIIISLFRDYFATDEQAVKLQNILDNNEKQYQEELRRKYNPDNIIKKKEEKDDVAEENNFPMEIKKESFFRKLIKHIKKLLNV